MSTTPAKTVKLQIDGRPVEVPAGTSVYDAAQSLNISIPILCHKTGTPAPVSKGSANYDFAPASYVYGPVNCNNSFLPPVGVCRACVVDAGARVYAAACVRPCEDNMFIVTGQTPATDPKLVEATKKKEEADKKPFDLAKKIERLEADRKTLIELLIADYPAPEARLKDKRSDELVILADKMHITKSPFPSRQPVKPKDPPIGVSWDLSPMRFTKGQDFSNNSIHIDHSACIVCDRCVRACTDIAKNFVIGRMNKGYPSSISFDTNKLMGSSSCVNCGACMENCPTSAITYGGKQGGSEEGVTLEGGKALSVDEMLELPIFQGITSEFLKRNVGSVVRRKFKKGEIICREGEFGSTAFYILNGKAEVFINTPMAHVKSDKKEKNTGGIFGIFRRFKHSLAGRKDDPREGGRRYIPIDATVDLSLDNPIATLKEQDLFGEMTCMSFQPRSATVRAGDDCEMLEMLRNVLQMLQKNRKFKEQLEKNYRERALGQHLRSVPILSGVDDKFIDQLKNRVELVHYDAGETIVRQGDVADAFFLIRVGCVKVAQKHPGGEIVITYLSRGEYFGEMGLLKGGKRTASCVALDHVEVVKIKKADFEFMLGWFEGLRDKFEQEAKKREELSRLMTDRAPSMPLDNFIEQGLMHAQSLLLLDLERCTRCDECVRACADAHDGVTRLVREGLRFDKFLVPTSCRSCMDPLCMIGCPVGSIRRKESLEVIIEDWCIGCGRCARQCPYGNISMHSFGESHGGAGVDAQGTGQKAKVDQKAVLCDLCTDLSEPSCVYACPHDAAHRVNAREFFSERMKGEAVDKL